MPIVSQAIYVHHRICCFQQLLEAGTVIPILKWRKLNYREVNFSNIKSLLSDQACLESLCPTHHSRQPHDKSFRMNNTCGAICPYIKWPQTTVLFEFVFVLLCCRLEQQTLLIPQVIFLYIAIPLYSPYPDVSLAKRTPACSGLGQPCDLKELDSSPTPKILTAANY